MKRTLFAIAAFCLGLVPSTAHACSCMTGSPATEFNRAKAVFVGHMLGGTEKLKVKGQGGGEHTIEAGRVRFSVEEVFKGDVSGEVTLEVASMDGTSCGPYGLTRGERYLVYAYRNEGEDDALYTGVCTRTQAAGGEYAREDFEFLRNMPAPGSGGNLSGRIWADLRTGVATPLADVRVNVRGADGQVRTAVTDKEGSFELRQLKAGKYTVEPLLPRHYTTENKSAVVEVDDRGTATVGFETYLDGRVTGRVVDRDGRGFNSVFLKLEGEGKRVYGHSTGEDGGFEVAGAPPGEYLLYMEMQHDDHEESRPYYFPGTYRREEAAAVKVGMGERVEGLEFRLPEGYKVRAVEGEVVWKDGSPAADVEVLLLCPESTRPGGFVVESGPPETRTDEQGRFRLEGLTGETYWLEARAAKEGAKKGEPSEWHSAPRKLTPRSELKNLKLVLSREGRSSGCGEN